MTRGDDLSASLAEADTNLPAPPAKTTARKPAAHPARNTRIQILHATETRIRLRAPGLSEAHTDTVRAGLAGLTGIRSVAVNPLTASVIVHFNSPADQRRIVSALRALLHGKPFARP